jgi:hypothetical protein
VPVELAAGYVMLAPQVDAAELAREIERMV